MTRRLRMITLTVLLIGHPGCAALEQFERALEASGIARFDAFRAGSVQVTRGGQSGRGVVIGERRVLTVGHVVADSAEPIWVGVSARGGRVPARIVRELDVGAEPLVELELEPESGPLGAWLGFQGFAEGRHMRPGFGAPAGVLTPRGYLPWLACALRPGDSGSPVLNRQGEFVGLIQGRDTRSGEPVMLRYPDDALPLMLARVR